MTETPINQNFNEISIGQKKTFNLTITDVMVEQFAKLSGDYNPLHMDEKYASSTKFKKRVCHGMLLSSFFSRLVGMYLPGTNALYLTQNLKFISPCFIDDNVTVEGEVIEKNDTTCIITLKTQITNDSNKKLVDGQAKVLVRE